MKCFMCGIVATLLISVQANAADLCSSAAYLVNSTTNRVSEYSSRNAMNFFTGSGAVKDVNQGSLSSAQTVIVDCGNHVLVAVPTNNSGRAANLKPGDAVRFSGALTGIEKRRYINSYRSYIFAYLNDDSAIR